MKRQSVFVLAIAFSITFLGICEFAFADPTWTIIDVPGADLTEIWAIDGSNLVGRYNFEGNYHGFLYDGVNFTTIDVPGGANIGVYGIDGDNLVGSYYTDEGGDPVIHGFLYDGTNYATVDFPGADHTEIRGITGSKLVGVYATGSDWHGFLYDGSHWTTIDAPGALDTYIRDIDGSNLVGWYYNGSYSPGFLYDGTNWTNIDAPGAYSTRVSGIDGSNLVGSYSVAGTWHGFLHDGTNLTTIDAPGASNTYIRDIDSSNLVGHYVGHGFIYTIPELTNAAPVADAGPDQTVFASLSGIAEFTFDGSDSTDPDGYGLTYTWYLDSQPIAMGVSPTIELPVGEHTIELIVNDGIVDSEPDYVIITVLRLAERICIVIEEKIQFIEQVNATLDKEQLTIDTLDEVLASGEYDYLARNDIVTARQKVHSAMQEQDKAIKAIEKSIENLEDALESLGSPVEP